jgi:hypothetical protein
VTVGGATVFGVEDLMKLHRGFVRRGEGKRLGRLVKIVLGEVPADVPLNLSKEEITLEGRTLDWFDQGPLLGLSPADVDLLVTTPMTPLPDKPKSGFVPPTVSQAEIDRAIAATGKWRPEQAPMVPQRPEDRGARRIKGTNILLFEPVHQVLFRPIGVNVFGCVEALSDPSSATVLTFVWDFDEGSGYFYGGRFLVKL